MDIDEDKIDLEEQFILRLSPDQAKKLRDLLHTKPDKIKKLLRISLNVDENHGTVYFGKTTLYGTLKKLPTIMESYKTNICTAKSTMFKTADVCQMLDCSCGDAARKDTIHGYCPPLKNVKTKRFRKTMYNTDNAIEAESVSKELYYLLSTDLEAASSKFEIHYEGKPVCSSKQYEKSLFGQLSSDSELSDNSG